MHCSLDGFVAGPQGEMDWITVDEEIFDYAGQRINETDTALYGRVTYQMMESYWPHAAEQPGATRHDIEHSGWYKGVAKIVLSTSLQGKPPAHTTIISDHIGDNIKAIKQVPGRDILIFGSPTATHALMKHDLIDDYWLFINPIVLGEGIPLFPDHHQRRKLRLKTSQNFSSGVIALYYEGQCNP
jgi:dihydrofolate reductase